MQAADRPIDVTTATQPDVSPRRPVVVTLVHGTVLFARWPRLLRVVDILKKVSSRGRATSAWYVEGSRFREDLSASLGPRDSLRFFPWSGGNTVWHRIVAAGAEGDFGEARSRRTVSLREHIKEIAEDPSGPAQVLVAHSHGGNVCLHALRNESTARAVDGFVCLSTPFVHARERFDSGQLDDALKTLSWIVYVFAFFGLIGLVSSRVPEPWDTVVLVLTFMVAIAAGSLWWGLRQPRQQALRLWADSMTQPQERPATMVLLSDGDEALLALKIAEGLNAIVRGLWRFMFWLPSVVRHTFGYAGRWLGVMYGVLVLAAVVFGLWNDDQSPLVDSAMTWSVLMVVEVLLKALAIPFMLVIALGLVLYFPVFIAMLLGYPVLMFSRWLAFGWGGSIGVEITAETCPLGEASITRLGPSVDALGLRHAHSYHDERAPKLIAKFVKSLKVAPLERGRHPRVLFEQELLMGHGSPTAFVDPTTQSPRAIP
jgi:hypothetical protein